MYSVRRATIDDLKKLVELRVEFLKEMDNIIDKKLIKQLTNSLTKYFSENLSNGNFIAWLAIVSNEIVGTSGLIYLQKPPSFTNISGNEAYIMNMYTKPNWRRKGVGKALFSKLLDEIRTKKIKVVLLHATDIGKPLYEKMGFKAGEHEMFLHINE